MEQTIQCSFKNFNNIMKEKYLSLYNRDYFRAYVNDPLREKMYTLELKRLLKYKNSGRILDVGCGLGLFLDLFDDKWDKYGVEVSSEASSVCQQKGIKMDGYDYPDNFFDVIVFRGSIQHIDTPLYVIKKCFDILKKGGIIAFLATPNTNSICYKLFEDLPMIDPKYNFVLFSDKMLKQILENFGFEILELYYPYIETPYAKPLRDFIYFILRLFGFKKKFAFYGNIMECYAKK